ncbi:hypothetical protein [Lacimicrobium alkaliphilum]|uniref:DUF2157 domain-containing protein n=1 Tax=Lacimicrobium alkaliphilum TaxID=1526571 RepID=A0A0U2JJK1_9ALTE|nr:hypothetical protein [Lacimicrobium alkaliphilum]ALS99718.1 hypothetical protein AT746_16555 [Lacimicrobium alkaliphilum]
MYTDEDLNQASAQGVLTEQSVNHFRQFINQQRHQLRQDQENFRLIAGFNDIFVVIACALVLSSAGWLTQYTGHFAGALAFSALSWGLAEVFVRRRKMALPAIGLLLSFLGGLIATPLLFADNPQPEVFALSGLLAAVGGWLHWRRFRVPVTVAAAFAATMLAVVGLLMSQFLFLHNWVQEMVFTGGLLAFGLAMYWDASDQARITRRSDVAFWLHLLAAPMLVHPLFSAMGILEGVADLNNMLIVMAVYGLLALVSITVDRRALMVSALGYVLYALSELFDTFGMVQLNFALTGICLGSALLLLSAFWHQVRELVMKAVPKPVHAYLPTLH